MNSTASTAQPHRWFGVGHSASPSPATAADAAVNAAVRGRDPSLLLVFCCSEYDLRELTTQLRRAVGPGPTIAGCTSMAQVVAGGPGYTGVTVIALGGAGFAISTTVSPAASGRQREAGGEAAGEAMRVDRPHKLVLLLTDGLTPMMDDIIRGAHAVAGATVPLVGGCASDPHLYERTYQFLGESDEVEVFTDAVIGVTIGSDAPMGLGIAHGWHKVGEPMIATGCEHGRIFEIDEKPALDEYLRRINVDEAAMRDLTAFRELSFGHPLGMSRRSSEDMRVIHAADQAERSLVCLAEVPQGALLWLMKTDEAALVDAAAQACGESVDQLGGAEPLGVIAFDCGARLRKLGVEGATEEIAAIAKVLGDTPFAGFYTFGEIARSHGARGIHHFTFVSLALA